MSLDADAVRAALMATYMGLQRDRSVQDASERVLRIVQQIDDGDLDAEA